ncbi:MAG: sugar phosphate isomerase/epimerase [Pirellulaceae bacterium]|jgi:sugar phosphate isomerase/epimerase|nr:sugar phosphate isomerase/epimerase [Pirellulaceae bacterium]
MIANYRTMSRRDFLAGGVAVAVGICSLGRLRQSTLRAAESSAKSKMRFGLTTYTWGKDWDIPTLITNCEKAGLYGVELRTSLNYAHGVELTLSASQRAAVKQRFADSPVHLVSIACSERLDWPEPDKLRAAIEASKTHLQLSHDIGCDVLRVFPNQFHRDVPRERTIEQIARALDELGAVAADLGQEVSLEAHGPAGELPTMRAIMERVTQRSVRVRLNCDARDAQGQGFVANFNMVKDFLSRIIHLHDLGDPKYPYQLMVDLLLQTKWHGWALAERDDTVPDRVLALTGQRHAWEAMIEKAP